MKKVLLVIGLLVGAISSINSQEISDNAIGLRLISNDGFGSEITYQRKIKENNRLEVNLGQSNEFNNLKVTGLYQWIWNLENKFNWYVGAGTGIAKTKIAGISTTNLFVTGNVGIEYNLGSSFLISLDYRPEYRFSGFYDGLNSDLGLSLRYQF